MNLESVKENEFLRSISKLPIVKQFYQKRRDEEMSERQTALQGLAKIAASEKERLLGIAERRSKAIKERDTLDRALVKANITIGELNAEENALLSETERRREPHIEVLQNTYHQAIDEEKRRTSELLEEARKAVRDERYNEGPRGKKVLVSNNDDFHRRAMYLFDSLKKIEDLKLTSLDDMDAQEKLDDIRSRIPSVRSVVRDGEKWVLA